MTNKPMKYNESRKQLAQNFLIHENVVKRLVGHAKLTHDDHVLEIGPGNGIITQALLREAGRVTAVELDKSLLPNLRKKFADSQNLELVSGDILKYKLPAEPYKIFANIPFNITAEIMQKLLWSKYSPDQAWFIMQLETAEKFVGEPLSTESSILFQPWFYFQIPETINRFEFRPVPSVNAALLHMTKRPKPRLNPKHKPLYHKFVAFGFRSWKKSLKVGYRNIFTYPQWKRLAKENRFSVDAIPSDLNLTQWLALFNYFLSGVSEEKKRPITSYTPQ